MIALFSALLQKKALGSVIGLLASKTQYGISTAAVTGLWTFLPEAIAGDPAAIGQVVLVVGGWIGALYGRLRAGK